MSKTVWTQERDDLLDQQTKCGAEASKPTMRELSAAISAGSSGKWGMSYSSLGFFILPLRLHERQCCQKAKRGRIALKGELAERPGRAKDDRSVFEQPHCLDPNEEPLPPLRAPQQSALRWPVPQTN